MFEKWEKKQKRENFEHFLKSQAKLLCILL